MIKIAIYGAGSLGTVLGAFMTRAGFAVDLINRNRAHVECLREKGARIIGKVNLEVKVNAKTIDEIVGKYDVIFLTTKVINNDDTIIKLSNYLEKDGVVCTIQNGLPEYDVAKVVGLDKTMGCAIAWGAELIEPGVSKLTSELEACTFSLGSIGSVPERHVQLVKKLLETMGPVEIDKNFIGARYTKLLINCAFSGLSAVTGRNFGEIVDDKVSRLYAQKIIKECIKVGHANNVKFAKIQGKDVVKLLDYSSKFKQKIGFMLIPIAIKKHRSITASMLQDLIKKKPCEINAINGRICDLAKAVSLEVPYNEKVVEIVKRIENGELEPTPQNLKFFKDIVE
ncbi:MAG: 2-dehydropantoate 2-reductase [Christensenellaceae bacterium]|jgi:2-dehydropantoate 2-reductase|nr:2-dehydropantoate 2-reductase [Christensenellaceae bacterium]